ncbi:MAG: hypothetical protein ACREA3_08100 [Nitrosotalea sp.]
MLNPHSIIETKSTLLSVIIFSLIGALSIPVILPHIFHSFTLFHVLLHISGVGFATFLTIVAAVAYSRVRTRRLLLTMIAFAGFVAAESFSLIDAAWQYTYYWLDFSAAEVGHLLMIFTLLMFALSVFRRD